MIGWLALLQWPLAVLPSLLVGAGVYGFDAGSAPARVMLVGLLSLVASHAWIERAALAGQRRTASIAGLSTALLGVAAYRPLHLGYWDERSLVQAVLLALLGHASLALAHVGAAKVRRSARVTSQPRTAALATALLGAGWVAWWSYPFAPLVVSACVGVAVFAYPGRPGAARRPRAARVASGPWQLGWGLAVFELSFAAWDRQLESGLGLLLALGCAGCAVGFAAVPRLDDAALVVADAVLVASVLFGALVPGAVLRPEHAFAAGAAGGLFLGHGLGFDGTLRPRSAITASAPGTLGWALGIAVAANLVLAPWRPLLLLGLVPVARLRRRSSRAAAGDA